MKQTRDHQMKQTTNETAVTTTPARVTTARLAIREARPRRLTNLLLWAVQIPLAAVFVIVALMKLGGGLVQEFGLIGAGQWLRYFVGTAELAGAIGLLTPWLAAGRRRAGACRARAGAHPRQVGGLAHDDGRVAASLDPHGRGSAPVPGERVGWIGVGDLAVQQIASG